MFAPDELIAALAEAGVDHVLIGGFAVGAHGFPRATKDVDIVPAPDASNLERLAAVLRAVEARHHGLGDFDPSEFPFDPLDPAQLAEGGNFVLMTRLGRLDVMQWVPGIPGELGVRAPRAKCRRHRPERTSRPRLLARRPDHDEASRRPAAGLGRPSRSWGA